MVRPIPLTENLDRITAQFVDMPSPFLKYIGLSEGLGDPSKPEWRIYREVVTGTEFQRLFHDYGKYNGIWNNRASLFPAPPATPAAVPGDEPTLSAIVENLTGLATEATLAALLAQNPTRISTVTLLTPVNVTNTGAIIAPANPARKGIIMWNNSSNSGYVSLASTGTSATPTWIVPTFTSKEYFGPMMYTGAIFAIRNGAATGNFACWEFT